MNACLPQVALARQVRAAVNDYLEAGDLDGGQMADGESMKCA